MIAFIFKQFFLPGGSLLLILSIGILAMMYFEFSFLLFFNIKLTKMISKGSYQDIFKGKTVGSILVGVLLTQLLI